MTFRLVLFISIITSLVTSGCSKEKHNPFLGKSFAVTAISSKSEVFGAINDGGTIRSLTDTELRSYSGDIAYTDAYDVSFIGTRVAFVSDDTAEYGRGSFASPFPYTVAGQTATVLFDSPPEPGFLRDRNDKFVMAGDGTLEKSVFYYRLRTDSGRRGSDGGQFEPGVIDELAAQLLSDGDVYTCQTMTFVYTEE
ncbi:hypothetical protein [Neolewinella sp.]|uniref:hypothetical protein n=1 Tax=Neolewinella sp. TaxID=2993543 RepID=UPI003B52BCED